MNTWFIDGEKTDCLPVDDRGAQYGDGVFETVAVRDGAARLWPLHLERLLLGCQRLGLQPPEAATISQHLDDALANGGVETDRALVKIILTAASGERGYRRPAHSSVIVRIGVFAAAPIDRKAYEQGVRLRLCQTRLAIQTQLAGIKSLNRLEQVLARTEWSDSDVFEGLTCDTAGRLICGTMSNVFLVLENGIATPAMTRCGVAGVMRRHVLTLLDENDIGADVRDIDVSELANAKEVFLTNSQFGVLPAAGCDKLNWPVGASTRNVMALAAASGICEDGQ